MSRQGASAGRVCTQFDGSQRQWRLDWLASYELVPGTSVYAGDGALFERRSLENDRIAPDPRAYFASRRGLLIKASYLYRF